MCARGGVRSGATILKMLPAARLQGRFARAVNQERLGLHTGFDDVANACKRNALYYVREIWSNDDELVFFTTMQGVIIGRSRPNRKAIFIDTGRDSRFSQDVRQ